MRSSGNHNLRKGSTGQQPLGARLPVFGIVVASVIVLALAFLASRCGAHQEEQGKGRPCQSGYKELSEKVQPALKAKQEVIDSLWSEQQSGGSERTDSLYCDMVSRAKGCKAHILETWSEQRINDSRRNN